MLIIFLKMLDTVLCLFFKVTVISMTLFVTHIYLMKEKKLINVRNLVLKHFHWLFLIQPAFCGFKKERQLFEPTTCWQTHFCWGKVDRKSGLCMSSLAFVCLHWSQKLHYPKGHIKIKPTVIILKPKQLPKTSKKCKQETMFVYGNYTL